MGRINVLKDEVINQIAAGEVIERPASIVKELVENSLDAGATEIRVELEEYGKKLLLVSDNGYGISEDDLVLAPTRHATSKISVAEDLWQLSTLGFRGEALSSIFAVGKCAISSRVASSEVGFEFTSTGEMRPVGMNVGAKVEVRDLFANIPARKKFLKSNQTELGHIREILERMALCNPNVRFTFINDKKTLEDYLPVTHLFDRVTSVMKNEIKEIDTSELIPLEETTQEMALQGVLWPSKITRTSNQKIFLFVNRRPIRDRLLIHAVTSGYQTLLPHGEYPIAVLFLDIDSTLVDVNVHPAKAEVRFVHTGTVHDFVAKNIRTALGKYRGMGFEERSSPAESAIREYTFSKIDRTNLPEEQNRHLEQNEGPRQYDFQPSKPLVFHEESLVHNSNPTLIRHSEPTFVTLSGAKSPQKEILRFTQDDVNNTQANNNEIFKAGSFSRLRLIGQAASSYLLCERVDALVIIDQHAAHERVRFENLRKQFEKGEVESQLLLVSELVELSENEVTRIMENLSTYRKFGWEIESFGQTSIAIKSVPAILGRQPLRSIISATFSELLDISSKSSLEKEIEKVLATVACHSAIRFNQSLTFEEMKNLLRELDNVELISNCPHGRPIVTEIPFKKLSTLFHRA